MEGAGLRAASPPPPPPRPRPCPRPGGERVSGSHELPARQPGPAPCRPRRPHRRLPPAGRPPARLLRLPPLRCAALPAPRAREGAAEEPPPAPGPRPPRPGPRHGALAAAAPGAARLGRCGSPRPVAPVGTMGPLLRRLLLAALLQLAPAQVRASRHPARPPAVPFSRLAEVGRREAASAEGTRGSDVAGVGLGIPWEVFLPTGLPAHPRGHSPAPPHSLGAAGGGAVWVSVRPGSVPSVPPSDLRPPEQAWSPGLEIGLRGQSTPGGSWSWPGRVPGGQERTGKARVDSGMEQSGKTSARS